MLNEFDCQVICHLFYPEIAQQLLQKLKQMDNGRTFFLINIQGRGGKYEALYQQVKTTLNNVRVITTPNKGRDIGAKLLLIDLSLQLRIISEYTLIIHDKKSPHLENGDFWREELFTIIEPKQVQKIFRLFEHNQDIGIIGTGKYIQNEYNEVSGSFCCNSDKHIKELLKTYNIQTVDYNFLAGNIFWIRTSLLQNFFAERPILPIRAQLETGNTLDFDRGTYIHSWERIMSWIATSQGYKIYGI